MTNINFSAKFKYANILSLGARFMKKEEIFSVIEIWLSEAFSGGRHIRRVNKLDN